MTDDDRAARCQVLEQGGTMVWQEFADRYGSDPEESPYWNWHIPETVMGRLRLRGLLAEATVDGVLTLCVPLELSPQMSRILAVKPD
jgi:hypothetical protein